MMECDITAGGANYILYRLLGIQTYCFLFVSKCSN